MFSLAIADMDGFCSFLVTSHEHQKQRMHTPNDSASATSDQLQKDQT